MDRFFYIEEQDAKARRFPYMVKNFGNLGKELEILQCSDTSLSVFLPSSDCDYIIHEIKHYFETFVVTSFQSLN